MDDNPTDPGFFLEQSVKNKPIGSSNMIYGGIIVVGILALIIIANRSTDEPKSKNQYISIPNIYIAYKPPPDRLNWVPKNVLNQELVIGNNRMENKTGVPLLYQPHPFDIPIT